MPAYITGVGWAIARNTNTFVGSPWISGITHHATGLKFEEKLFLPAAGYRNNNFGDLIGRGVNGRYWSNTPQPSEIAEGLSFNEVSANMASSFSVCYIE